MLVNSTPTSELSKNLESIVRIMCPNMKIIELPNIDHMRKMRGVIRMQMEMFAIYRLSKNKKLRQLW